MNNSPYWVGRAQQVLIETERNTSAYLNQLNVTYKNAAQSIDKAIEKIFSTYKQNFTLEQARAWLNEEVSPLEYSRLKDSLSSITDVNVRKKLLMRLNAPAYRYRIARLEQVKQEIIAQLVVAADTQHQICESCFVDTINYSYERTMFNIQQGVEVAFNVAKLPQSTINQLLSSKWVGRNFSESVWHNCDAVAKAASEVIKEGVLSGQSIPQMSKALMEKTYTTSMYNATRLIRTEVNYFSNQGTMESYREAELDKYEFLATLDLRTSTLCQEHDSLIYLLDEAVVGENYPPLHAFCRSTTIPIIEGEGIERINKRRARDPVTGKGIVIDKMSYQEWRKRFVNNNPHALVNEKKIKNQYSDKKQHDKYKAVFGNDMPKSLDKFQDLKYNRSKEFEFIELDYARRNKLKNSMEFELPNSHTAKIADEKFTKYLFDESNPKGYAKGKAITSRLGYDIDNWKELRDMIQNNAYKYPVTVKSENQYGILYEQKQIIYGLNGKPANMIVGWLADKDKTHMTSAYIKEMKSHGD